MNKTYVDDIGYLRFKDTNKLVHRWVAEKKYGKEAIKGMEIHHIDGEKTNNNKDNLILLMKEDHYLLQEYEKENIRPEGMIEIKSWARYLLFGIIVLQMPFFWTPYITQFLTIMGVLIVYSGTRLR